jgi:hypothetical protein
MESEIVYWWQRFFALPDVLGAVGVGHDAFGAERILSELLAFFQFSDRTGELESIVREIGGQFLKLHFACKGGDTIAEVSWSGLVLIEY